MGDHTAEWRALIAATEVRGGIPLTFKVQRETEHEIHIEIGMSIDPDHAHTMHAMPGDTVRVILDGFTVQKATPPDSAQLLAFALMAYEHELKEQFHVGAARPFDPHV